MAKNVKHEAVDVPLRRTKPAPHWNQLRQGDRVRVVFTPGFESGGLVDAITGDHTAVWINLDGGRGRTMLHCTDGVEILPEED